MNKWLRVSDILNSFNFISVSIKEEETPVEKKTTVEPPKPKPAPKKAQPKETQQPAVTEVSRTARTRDDGTQYFEVEYSDGSMEDINA